LAELDYRKRKGELLDAALARSEFAKVILLIVSRLENFPSKVGPLLVNQNLLDIVETLQSYMDDLRHELADPITYGRKAKTKKREK
jgi:hypothetical protein